MTTSSRLSRLLGVVACGVVWLSGCSVFSHTETVDVMQVYGSPDEVELELVIGSCNADLEAVVDETAAEVVITVTARNNNPEDCADTMRVALDEPLGDRIVIDGGRTIEVPVGPGDN